jgi:hypothetical protein
MSKCIDIGLPNTVLLPVLKALCLLGLYYISV